MSHEMHPWRGGGGRNGEHGKGVPRKRHLSKDERAFTMVSKDL